jgi:hypothetical protein
MKDVEVYCRRCEQCCKFKKWNTEKHGELQYVPTTSVWSSLHADLTGPHVRSRNGYKYILTVLDSFSKFLVTVPLRDKTTESVARALVKNVYLTYGIAEIQTTDHVYLTHGIAEIQTTDRGKEFFLGVIDNLYKLLGITRKATTSFRLSANGQVERVHGSVGAAIAKVIEISQRDWDEKLPYVT